MKDQDLVIKAVKAFPVWPEWAEVILFNTLTNEFCMSATTENEFNMGCAKGLTDRKAWQIVINREQHIAELDGDKKRVPEVGQECLAYEYSTQQNRESIYIGDDPRSKDSTWKAFSSITTGQPFFSDRYEFRPLKTETDKKLELLSSSFLAAFDSVSDDFPPIKNEALHALCKAMTDLGFTAPNKDTRPLEERAQRGN